MVQGNNLTDRYMDFETLVSAPSQSNITTSKSSPSKRGVFEYRETI